MDFKKLLVLLGISFIVSICVVMYYILFDDTIYDDPNIEAVPFSMEDANSLLEEFGFNKRFGCTTIAQKKYTNTFKAIMALSNVDSSKINEDNCSNLYGKDKLLDKGLESERYQGETGSCIKSSKVISYDDANYVYHKMYGTSIPRISIDSKDVHNLLYESYDYLADKDIFVRTECYNCLGACYSLNIREVKSATIKKDILRIDFYDYESGLFELNDNHYTLITSNFSKSFECTYNDECIDIIRNNYMDKLDLYEAIFQKVDDHFVFKKFILKTN